MPRRKDISNDLREAIGDAHQSGKCQAQFKTIWSPSFYSEQILFKSCKHQNSCQYALGWMSQQIHLTARTCNAWRNCKNPQSYISVSKEITERLPRESAFCLKRTWQCCLGSQSFIWMFFGQARPKWRYLAIISCATFWQKYNTEHKHLISTVNHGCGDEVFLKKKI